MFVCLWTDIVIEMCCISITDSLYKKEMFARNNRAGISFLYLSYGLRDILL